MTTSGGTMSYERARGLVVVAGSALLVLISLLSIWRGVDQVEVLATLFFVPILIAIVFFGTGAALATAAVASLGYIAMRWPAIQLVGWDPLIGQIVARVLGYFAFAAAGGWAAGQVKTSLDKLALHDDVDDETGLGNAQAFLSTVDREKARAARYQHVFSVVAAEFHSPAWDQMGRRRARTAMHAFGRRIATGVRASDTLVHARAGKAHLLAAILPETGPEGANAVGENLRKHLAETEGTGEVQIVTTTFPGGEKLLEELSQGFRIINRSQRPPTG
ncbi:MAG TPA: diguanylate cyclase [Acidimicrobiia bacterium]